MFSTNNANAIRITGLIQAAEAAARLYQTGQADTSFGPNACGAYAAIYGSPTTEAGERDRSLFTRFYLSSLGIISIRGASELPGIIAGLRGDGIQEESKPD